jgi:proline dehydrogenase
MFRSTLLWLSERRGLFNFIRRNGLARQFAARFVAGETLDDAIAATRELNAKDITATLDLLGESVTTRAASEGARDAALGILDRIHQTGVRGNLSVKLTQMGLDLDPALAAANMKAILDRARTHDTFVRIDMEASAYVERTLDLYHTELQACYGDLVGVVLLQRGNYPAFATHDERLIGHVTTHARDQGIDATRFEFQMLYGVRRDLQERLRREGYNVRVYVPFGTEWYPYLMRRLAERPANIAFIVGNVLRETFGRTRG